MKRSVRSVIAVAMAMAFVMLGAVSPASAGSERATRKLSGVAQIDWDGVCDAAADGIEAELFFTLVFDGEGLEGCWYLVPENVRTTPSGMLIEEGYDVFVGTLDGEPGRFVTTYIFRGKYEDLSDPTTEIFGFCQHKLVEGEGAFEGIEGIVHIRDDVVNVEFPWTAQLKQR